jgi:hypothetical protein
MDEVDRIPEMVAFAESLDLDEVSTWLADMWV